MASSKIEYSNNGQENLSLQSFYSLRYNLNELQAFAQMKILGSNQRFVKSFGLQYSPSFVPFLFFSGGYKEDYVLANIVSRVTGGIDFRAKNLDALDNLEENSMDFYASVKSLYLQDRQQKILNSNKTTEAQDDSDWDEVSSE